MASKKVMLVIGCCFICSCLFLWVLIIRSSSPSIRVGLPLVSMELPPLKHMNTSLEEYMTPLRDRFIPDKYTVLMPTYRRNDLLVYSLKLHCSCIGVDRIVVIWNNVHETVPQYLVEFPCPVEIIFIQQQRNSLNNRFKPYTQIRTEGVLVIDDDRLEKHKDIDLAYKTWKEHKQLLVGFQSYIHGYNRTSRLYYLENRMSHRPSIGKNRTTYSLVLTTGFFINLFYLRMYTDLIPDTIKLFVDTKFNGEDIVMNFMVAQHLYEETRAVQTSCLWVQGTAFHLEWSAKRFRGINHVVKHFLKERNQLLNMLADHYNRMALHNTSTVIYNRS